MFSPILDVFLECGRPWSSHTEQSGPSLCSQRPQGRGEVGEVRLCTSMAGAETRGTGCWGMIQGSNPGLLHCRQILYHLSQQGSPGKLFSQHFKVPAWEKPRLRSPVPSPTSASSRAQHCLLDAHPHLYSSSNVHRSYSGACFSDEELEFSTLNDTL